MARLLRWSLLAAAGLAVVGVVLIAANSTWRNRAETICAEDAPRGATASSVQWEWKQAAYVCTHGDVAAERRRVGIVEGLHGDRGPQHPGR